MTLTRGFGRLAEPARLVLAALREGPGGAVHLFDAVRALDGPIGPIGPGTFFAAIARLERHGLIERHSGPDDRIAYRLADGAEWLGAIAGGAGS